MKLALSVLLCGLPVFAEAAEITPCKGSALQRRVALLEFGKVAQGYIDGHGTLPNICQEKLPEVSERSPELLRGTLLCGSSKEGAVFYACELRAAPGSKTATQDPVVERCRYSLSDQSLACEHQRVVTTIEE